MKQRLGKVTVNYESFGRGRPFIALHGFSPDHRLMKGCLEPVFKRRKGWKRFYPDLPGMGKTKGEKWITGSDQMLEVVLEFIEKMIPGQHFVLAGESYGGYLARAVVHRKYDLVDGLLLICPSITPDKAKRRLPERRILVQDAQFLSTLGKDELADFKGGHTVLTRHVWDRYRKEVIPGLEIADYEFLRGIEKNRAFSFDLEAEAKVFGKPSLLFAGRQDMSVGYHDSLSILDKYPRMTFAILDKASHDLEIEQDKVFNALVNEWLDRVEESKSWNPQILFLQQLSF